MASQGCSISLQLTSLTPSHPAYISRRHVFKLSSLAYETPSFVFS